MNMIEIERALRELRLSGIAETLPTRVMQAQAAQEPFLETFAAMLQDELDRRRSRLTERRFKRSGLDEKVSLADFDWRFNPKLPRSACFELHTLKFIGEGANALIIGKPGTGKSHVAKAVAYQATLQGYDVRYLEADTEFARYALASTAERSALLKDWVEPDLLVLDDLFLARRISEHAAEELQDHRMLVYNLANDPYVLHVKRRKEARTIGIVSTLDANEGQVIRAAAVAGLGILIQPQYIIHDDLLAGRLIPVLKDWELPHLTINIAYQSRRHQPAKVRVFVEFLLERFANLDLEKKWATWAR